MTDNYDAIVIGGGPGGSTAAAVLARAGWRVAIIEQKEFPRRKVCGEYLSQSNWPVLQKLGVADHVLGCAGPEVTHMAVFSGKRVAYAELPGYKSGERGRALTRDRLDVILLNRATELGATIMQPWKVLSARRALNPADGYVCLMQSLESRERKTVYAKIIVAANGSWETSPFENTPVKTAQDHDLFGFKAHFRKAKLKAGLMPLLSFRNGFGGMAHCQDELVSLSCCIRRSQLNRLPHLSDDSAGDRVFEFIKRESPSIAPVFDGAVLEGPWLSAGPLQPGIRTCYGARVFSVGNAAAEAHPVIAEGITIAIQSAWMMGDILAPFKNRLDDKHAIDEAGRIYSMAWKKAFATRIRASFLIAHWAMRPWLVQAAMPVFQRWPRFMCWCAEVAGKGTQPFETHHTRPKAAT